MFPRLFLLCIAMGSFATYANAEDWPQWHGPNRDNKSNEKGLLSSFPEGGPKVVWSVNDISAVGTGYGCPAVVSDKLFILGGDSAKKDTKESCVCLTAKPSATSCRRTISLTW